MSRSAALSLLACLALCCPILIGQLCFQSFDAYAHNDDFLYARCTQILIDEGRYQHVSQHGQLAASVASHCLWGALVCLPTGFSYDQLHLAVGLAATLGVVAIYLAARELGGSHRIALLSAMAMLVGPFYYGMSFTFMTDVTAASMASIAVFGYARGVVRDSMAWLIVGSIGASLAMWSRQTHLCVIAVPTIALIGDAWHRRRFRRAAFGLLASCALPLLSFLVFELGWLVPGDDARVGIVDVETRDLAWLKQTIVFVYAGGLLTGLAALPLLPLLVARVCRPAENVALRKAQSWATGLVGLLWAGVFAVTGLRTYITQATGYILYNAHLGPILLADQDDPGRWSDIGGVSWPPWIWQIVTALSIISLALLAGLAATSIGRLIRRPHESGAVDAVLRRDWFIAGLIGCMLAASAALLAMVEMVYDRYWMLLYPMLFPWIGSQRIFPAVPPVRTVRGVTAAVAAMILLMFTMSFVFVHDFLAWNDARHDQVRVWLDQGLAARDFDAGNGINGWLRSAEDVATHGRPGDDTPFWRGLAQHALAIGPRPGWEVEKTISWRSWAAAGKQCTLYVLNKRGP
ncbi:ArnT family glycosyltransferase [Roseiconus nitratireducens]|uniref:ArnT family glycosyltransferase n=1 Tax=Roseiconus nitratireducens TaxID=2605748 RepID=UPI0013758BC6|nr:glycosyltransferase family 39 protein [Roseiconus nitratireducens]